jgi:hypothetical protein
MADGTHLDGNALAGLLDEAFGREMTTLIGCCAGCGATNALGALLAYRAGLGDVLRCPACSIALVIITHRPDGTRISLASLRWIEAPPGA